MKVLNYTTSYFAVILLVLIPIWAGIFYYAMLDEIYDSIDDGLDNQKGLIIQKATVDSSILFKSNFEEGDYSITEINPSLAVNFTDVYVDTTMYMQNESEFEPVRLLRTVFLLKGKYYQMQVITSMVEEDDLIAELLYALIWLYAGLVATILLLNNYLLKRIWRPFNQLLNGIKDFKLEKPKKIQMAPTKIDEFQVLHETVQRMLQSNIDSYDSQKRFIENASHELQTPLAISINKLEALAERSNLSEEDLKLLASALDNLERLTRLNKSLLLLSRIENRQFITEEEVDVNTAVKKMTEDFSDQAAYSKLTLDIVENATLVVRMNTDLASILFTNLIKNAIVHNYSDGVINIVIEKERLIIFNTGQDKSLDQDKVFMRFAQETRSPASTGLGLAIVKAIAELNQFAVSYAFENQMHRITIVFK